MRADFRAGLDILKGSIKGQRAILDVLADPSIIHDERTRAHLAGPVSEVRALLAEGEREYEALRRLLGAAW